jgi:hypothetical protein
MKLLSQNIPCAPDEDGNVLAALCQIKYELFLTVKLPSEVYGRAGSPIHETFCYI